MRAGTVLGFVSILGLYGENMVTHIHFELFDEEACTRCVEERISKVGVKAGFGASILIFPPLLCHELWVYYGN